MRINFKQTVLPEIYNNHFRRWPLFLRIIWNRLERRQITGLTTGRIYEAVTWKNTVYIKDFI